MLTDLLLLFNIKKKVDVYDITENKIISKGKSSDQSNDTLSCLSIFESSKLGVLYVFAGYESGQILLLDANTQKLMWSKKVFDEPGT